MSVRVRRARDLSRVVAGGLGETTPAVAVAGGRRRWRGSEHQRMSVPSAGRKVCTGDVTRVRFAAPVGRCEVLAVGPPGG
ncbi:hypothetical protein [Micromonospora maritima]|uniref:hypothetical protein n=1 Tax=Micromonospora maritima TaxID=986711 RepID=UPI0031E80013